MTVAALEPYASTDTTPATRPFDVVVALPADAPMSRAEHRIWYWAHLDELCELLSRKTDAEMEAFTRALDTATAVPAAA